VGFRPYVYRLARELELDGYVRNDARGVLVEIEGTSDALDEFLARLEEMDAPWAERVASARDRGQVIRYHASVTPEWARVGIAEIDATSSLAGLSGTDNQFVFTTERYRSNPLVITGPGAGPAVTAAGVLNDVLKAASTGVGAPAKPRLRQRPSARSA
jgi:homoserine dehydrogenase